jgi:uncharacterized membrane protein
MLLFHPKTPLDKAFEVTLIYKGIDGLLEMIGGVIFLFIRPTFVLRLAHGVVGYHPHNFIGKHVLQAAQHFGKGAAIFAALYLFSHGIVKVVLVVEILREKLWAYVAFMIVTGLFAVYQVYDIIFRKPTVSFMLLTILDLVIIYLTNKEYRKHKVHLAQAHAGTARTE